MTGVVIALMGVGGGIVGVLGMTWLQQQTTAQMQGRMMSLVMFASVALDPFSQAISGGLMEVGLTGLFVAAGIAMLLTALVSWLGSSRDRPR
jgi:MFS family permease